MLQHAFLTPATPANASARSGQATYADLFQLAVHAVGRAVEALPEAQQDAVFELRGFDNFLAASGRHLQQVLPLAPPSLPARLILRTLQSRQPLPVRVGTWADAARAVGLMSELVATHHTGTAGPFTPEMQDLYRTRGQDLALGRLYALLLAACLGGRDLTRQAAALRLQSARTDADRLDHGRLRDLNRVIESVVNQTQSGLWHMERAAGAVSQLDALSTATPHVAATVESRSFPDAFSAVRTLRRISFRQALGLEWASPGSLNDLARLAADATDPSAQWIRSRNDGCTGGLERLQLAHFRDQLARAHQSWTDAPEGLTTNIQGLTKAPASLASAIREASDQLDDPRVASAVVQALPQLGRDASTTVTQLGSQGSLVAAGREPGALSISWRPITPGQTRQIAKGFASAGKASVAPASTYRDLEMRPSGHRREQQLDVDAPRVALAMPGQERTP